MSTIKRVIVCDDHPLLRAGLNSIVSECTDIEIATEVSDGHELMSALREQTYDLVLLDLMLPGRSGLELLKQIKQELPRLPVIVLSSNKEDIYAVRAIRGGAAGYICKDYAAERLIEAIRKAAQGGTYISPSVAELLAKELNAPRTASSPQQSLSDREYQVFMLIANGLSSSQIAEQLNVSIKTISTHRARIKEKTGLSNTSEIVRYAVLHKLTTTLPQN